MQAVFRFSFRLTAIIPSLRKNPSLTNEEAIAYSRSYYKEFDHQSAIRLAEKKALKKGHEEGNKQTQYEDNPVTFVHDSGQSLGDDPDKVTGAAEYKKDSGLCLLSEK